MDAIDTFESERRAKSVLAKIHDKLLEAGKSKVCIAVGPGVLLSPTLPNQTNRFSASHLPIWSRGSFKYGIKIVFLMFWLHFYSP